MGAAPLTAANRDLFRGRIAAIRADSKRNWGSLEPAGMLAHLIISLEGALGDFPVDDHSTFFSRQIVRRIAIDSPLPFPKGKIKVPDHFTPAPRGDVAHERERLFKAIDRFLEAAEREPNKKTAHPFFGLLTLRYWQKLHGKHMNHHFEQFSV